VSTTTEAAANTNNISLPVINNSSTTVDDTLESNTSATNTSSGSIASPSQPETSTSPTSPEPSTTEPSTTEPTHNTTPVDAVTSLSDASNFTPPPDEGQDDYNEGDNTLQGTAEDILMDEGESHVMWWAFVVFLALLMVGVSGYLLFNHHAKVKEVWSLLVDSDHCLASSYNLSHENTITSHTSVH